MQICFSIINKMRVFIKTLLFILLLNPSFVFAADIQCSAGQYYDTATKKCAGCDEGYYCPGDDTSQSCPSTHPKSAAGATTEGNCYKQCAEEEPPFVANGKMTYEAKTIYLYDHDQNCPYTIECNNSTDICNGYHLTSDNRCILNNAPCIASVQNGKIGVMYWDLANNRWNTTCYVTKCQPGYNVAGSDPHNCATETLHIGTSCDSELCSDILGNCTDGDISGKWTWNWTDGSYIKNFSECICSSDKTIDHGQGKKSCTHKSDIGIATQWECTNMVDKCDAGYCETDGNPGTCSAVSAGYYSATGATKCSPCPAGSTSAGRAAAITDCYITSETQFCDETGNCFTLPGTGQIKYSND